MALMTGSIISAVSVVSILLFFLRRNGLIGLLMGLAGIASLSLIMIMSIIFSATITAVGTPESIGSLLGLWFLSLLALAGWGIAMAGTAAIIGVVTWFVTILVVLGTAMTQIIGAFFSINGGLSATYGDTLAIAGVGPGLIFFLPAFYIAWRIRRNDPLFAGLRQLGLWFGSFGGTNFQGAVLTDARFCEANLKHVRFVGVKAMDHVDFRAARQLKFAYTKGTLLETSQAHNLLTTSEGSEKLYTGLNLTGAFLIDAKLLKANLTETNLSDADLTGTDLSDAKLIKTQFIGANLTGARLTGACIEGWNIDKTTRLQDIDCEYVFLEADNPKSRQPPSGVFAPGEFSKLFQEVAETMDFIVESRLELDALLQAIQKLREAGNEGLEVQGVERKDDNVVVHVATPPEMDRERIHREITLLKTEYEAKLLGKDQLIGYLNENVIRLEHLLAERGNTYIEKVEGNAMTHAQTITGSTIIGSTLNQGTIHGRLANLARDIDTLPATGETAETGANEKLAALLAELAEMLKDVPSGQAENAEAVATMVERAVEDARTGKRSLLKDTGEGLKKYAQPISEYSPAVLQCVTEIMKLLGG